MTGSNHVMLSIEGMSCASCVARVTRGLSRLDGVSDVSVTLADERAQMDLETPDRLDDVVRTLDKLGYPARRATVVLNVASMSCASCVGRVDRVLSALPGVIEVAVNLAAETATVTYLEGAVSPEEMIAAADKIGYPATLAEPEAEEKRGQRKEAEAREIARKALIAAALALPVFVIEMGGASGACLAPLDRRHHRPADQLDAAIRADHAGADRAGAAVLCQGGAQPAARRA